MPRPAVQVVVGGVLVELLAGVGHAREPDPTGPGGETCPGPAREAGPSRVGDGFAPRLAHGSILPRRATDHKGPLVLAPGGAPGHDADDSTSMASRVPPTPMSILRGLARSATGMRSVSTPSW